MRGWGDPLAQSFLVDTQGGMDMTSIDIFFAKKDKFMPCSVQIRNMVNGYPGQLVLPFSDVTKNPADINVSADGSAATTYTFDSPVHLEQGNEYCFVVYSNSDDYEAYISRMGETDLLTAETISGQPYAGSLFMSQNASTWTAEQTDDLKFNMKIAEYDIGVVGSVHFENDAIPATPLQNNPIETCLAKTGGATANDFAFGTDLGIATNFQTNLNIVPNKGAIKTTEALVAGSGYSVGFGDIRCSSTGGTGTGATFTCRTGYSVGALIANRSLAFNVFKALLVLSFYYF